MSEINLNSRIKEGINEIEDENLRNFLNDAIAFERSKSDREQPHFRNKYYSLLDEYVDAPDPESDGTQSEPQSQGES